MKTTGPAGVDRHALSLTEEQRQRIREMRIQAQERRAAREAEKQSELERSRREAEEDLSLIDELDRLDSQENGKHHIPIFIAFICTCASIALLVLPSFCMWQGDCFLLQAPACPPFSSGFSMFFCCHIMLAPIYTLNSSANCSSQINLIQYCNFANFRCSLNFGKFGGQQFYRI